MKQKLIELLKEQISKITELQGIDFTVDLERPANSDHGDWSSNLALKLAGQLHKSPREIAELIKSNLTENSSIKAIISKIEVAGPGFVNFYLHESSFIQLLDIVIASEKLTPNVAKPEKIYVEYVGPNTNKPLHIGHLRNAVLGIALTNLLAEVGHQVIPTTINNDRGIAIVRGMWGYLMEGQSVTQSALDNPVSVVVPDGQSWQERLAEWTKSKDSWSKPDMFGIKPDHWVGIFYIIGTNAAEYSESYAQDMQNMLIAWEDGNAEVLELWNVMNEWFYAGNNLTLQRLGVKMDILEYESQLYKNGKQIVLDAVRSGVTGFSTFEDGAVNVDLSSHKLPNKVLIRRDGTAIYMTFDIELTRRRTQEYGMDKGIWVVGMDQELHFQQLFVICEMLGFGRKEQWTHYSYGMVELPEGKMSSRKGITVNVDDVLDEAYSEVMKVLSANENKFNFDTAQKEDIAEKVGVGAVKYYILSYVAQSKIKFQMQNAVNFDGNSGPYIQYVYARCQSILSNAQELLTQEMDLTNLSLDKFEKALVAGIERYSEIVEKAAAELAPHLVTTYLFELAQKYNNFYANDTILSESDANRKLLRLKLTAATAKVVKSGLALLGIDVVEKM